MPDISPQSPEARRKRLARAKRQVGRHIGRLKPSERVREVLKRVAVGVYTDGFIHAGNLAFMAMLSLFPFVIVAAAVARLLGESGEGMDAVIALLQTMPPGVAEVLSNPIGDILEARSGNLLWMGALVGLWTTGSFIETIRDILRRAYGTRSGRPFYEYRLLAIAIIIGSVIMAMLAFTVSVFLASIQQFIVARIPGSGDIVYLFNLFKIVPTLVLFGALYLLFFSLTPGRYRKHCPIWPGAAFVALWWSVTTALLPVVLSQLGTYDLTYGSLAGVVIAMTFFFIIGVGLVVGAELNAALAETPEEDVDGTAGPCGEEKEKA
ncbi:MAG: YihY/virulence factor BrkB family protein [Sphingomonadaceae bacterium]